MDCRTCQSLLSEYALGSLTGEEQETVARHLEGGCTECRRALRETQEAWTLLVSALPPADVPPHVQDALRTRIARERERTGGNAPQSRPAFAFSPERDETETAEGARFRVWLAVAASLFIAATIALVSWLTYMRGQWEAQNRELARRSREMQRLEQELSRADELFKGGRLHFASLREAGPQSAVRGYVVWDRLSRQVHFYAFGLRQAAEGRVWRIWISGEEGQSVAAGTLTPQADGTASAIVDVPADLGERFRLSVVDGPIEPPAAPADVPWVTADVE